LAFVLAESGDGGDGRHLRCGRSDWVFGHFVP
jgi:hypothetical protein